MNSCTEHKVFKKNIYIKIFVLFFLCVIIIYFTKAYAYAYDTRITVNSSNQYSPSIDGNKIVYFDYRNGNFDVYLYNLITGYELQITFDTSEQWSPDVSNNKIVWEDDRNGNADIYMYDLAGGIETRITADPSDQWDPAIYGNKIVWEDYRNGNADIYMYDLVAGTERRITSDPEDQYSPAMSGNKIVWVDNRNGNADIYMYDSVTGVETGITNGGSALMPDIYGNKVVWGDFRNGNYDIYMYDLAADVETRITTDPSDQIAPAAYGNKIVWEDYRNVNSDIYMYDLTYGFENPITVDSSGQWVPAIYGNNIVYEDDRNMNNDIYMSDLMPLAKMLQINTGWDSGPNNWDWSGTKLVTGDFNGDGLDDIVAFYGYFSQRETMAWVFINNGTGGYNAPAVWWSSGPNNWDWEGTKLEAGDFNGDGIDDIVAFYGYFSQRETRAWEFNSTGSSFNAPQSWWSSGPNNWDWEGTKLEAGDFNGDSYDDLVAYYGYLSEHQTKIWMFKSAGNNFGVPSVWWDSGPNNWDWAGSKIAAGDVNGDGLDDLGVLYGYSGDLTKIWQFDSESYNFAAPYVSWNSGTGNWKSEATLFASGNFDDDMLADFVGFYGYATQRQVRAINLR